MQYIQRVKYALSKVQQQIAARMNKRLEKYKEINSSELKSYEVGDKVALEIVKISANDQLSNKLSWKFEGPYTIIRKGRNEKVYYLKDAFDEELPHPISIDRIKSWIERPVEERIVNDYQVNDDKNNSNDEAMETENQPLIVVDPASTYAPPLKEAQDIEAHPPKARPVSTRQSARLRDAANDPLLGKRVKVKWPDNSYRCGTVKAKCSTKDDRALGTHKVLYEFDNEEYYERLDGSVRFEIVNCMLTRAWHVIFSLASKVCINTLSLGPLLYSSLGLEDVIRLKLSRHF
jgi:hypothetical protein